MIVPCEVCEGYHCLSTERTSSANFYLPSYMAGCTPSWYLEESQTHASKPVISSVEVKSPKHLLSIKYSKQTYASIQSCIYLLALRHHIAPIRAAPLRSKGPLKVSVKISPTNSPEGKPTLNSTLGSAVGRLYKNLVTLWGKASYQLHTYRPCRMPAMSSDMGLCSSKRRTRCPPLLFVGLLEPFDLRTSSVSDDSSGASNSAKSGYCPRTDST